MTLQAHALRLVNRGFVVFPISPGGTRPVVKFGTDVAENEEQATKWWRSDRSRKNIGIRCGWSEALQTHVIVLDIDVQHDGDKTIIDLLNEHGPLPDTYAVTTPSGGMHFYFYCDKDIRNSAGKIGQGIDIRGHNGFVVAAGSVRDETEKKKGGVYEAANDLPLAELPDWIEAICLSQSKSTSAVSIDSDSAVEDVPLGARNNRLFNEACGLRGKGWKADAIFQALSARNQSFSHPVDSAELKLIASQAAKYAPNTPSLHDAVYTPNATKNKKAAKSDDEPVQKDIRLRQLSTYTAKKVSYLWRGLFPLSSVSIIAGDPGQAKTSFLLKVASAITTGGTPLENGPPVPQGSVVFATAEDSIDHTVLPRVLAAKGDPRCFYNVDNVDLDLIEDYEAMNDAIGAIGDVRLLIIDPVTAFMAKGADGNSNTDVRTTLRSLSDIAEAHKLAVVGISHLNKDTRKSVYARLLGSVGWVAAPRAVYLVNENPELPGQSVVACAKTNFEPPEPIAFRKHIIDVETDEGPASQVMTELEEYDGALSMEELFASKDKKLSKTDIARAWLQERLGTGEEVAVSELKREVEAGGQFSWRTLNAAKAKLDINVNRRNEKGGKRGEGGSYWSMDAQFGAHPVDAKSVFGTDA